MYEDYSQSKVLSIDIETFDPELIKMGTGVYRSRPLNFTDANGYILGVSMIDEHGTSGYYPLGHYDTTPEVRSKNIEYLARTLAADSIKIGANLMYDFDWLENWLLVPVNGEIVDVQIAEALLDETQRKYNLDFMGKKYFDEGKEKGEIEDFCYANGLKGDPRKHLWKMPSYMVEAYAIQDVDLPIRIWEVQKEILEKEDLMPLMKIECELLRVLLLMRKTGVNIDTKLRDKHSQELKERLANTYLSLSAEIGRDFNYNSSKQLAEVMREYGIPYPSTEKGNPSINKDFLERLSKGQVEDLNGDSIKSERQTRLGHALLDIRKADKVLKTFIDGSLVRFITKGDQIHCSFNSMQTDDYGTKSGRFSSSNPNLQQIPAPSRDPYYGTMARDVFIPHEGCWMAKIDYSQIEYRFIAHYAKGKGSDEIRKKYNDDPTTDYHKYIQDLTGLIRSEAKTVNFGIAYGMGAPKMAKENQWDLDYCYGVLNTYHKNAPFVKTTINAVEQVVRQRGYIKTILGRRARLRDKNKAYTFYNRLMQGSAADQMKKAMLDVYKAGLFKIVIPHLTVHDELVMSVPKTKEGIEAIFEVKNVMENCIKLLVPVVADLEIGEDWANVREVTKNELYKMLEEADNA